MAKRRKAKDVDVADIKRVYTLFLDEKRSVSYLLDAANAGEFIGDDGKFGDGQVPNGKPSVPQAPPDAMDTV